jgi:5'-3' exonuclease
LSSNGQPVGGFKGFLKILNKLVREISPDQIVICWDGPGGSRKRKSVNKNYKEGRSPIRLNRDIRNLTETEELSNKIWQQTRLYEYLNEMPIVQFMFEDIEADDLISYVVNSPHFSGDQKVIVSSDKDFFQLLDEHTVLYRPVQKEVLNKNSVIEKFNIHPTNFALARAMTGDKSDNLAGIGGVGLATVSKRIPFLAEEKSYTVEEVLEHCRNADSELKCYSSILDGEKTIRQNYKLMQLYSPAISVQVKQQMRSVLEENVPQLNKTKIRTMFIQDGIGELILTDLFTNFRKTIFSWKSNERK